MVDDFSHAADFLLVYVEEAHPSDGWAVPGALQLGVESVYDSSGVRTHRDMSERAVAARDLARRYPLGACRLAADSMAGEANAAFGASFGRACVLSEGRVAYLSGKGPFLYSMPELRRWLCSKMARGVS
ncbi:unnamed protein product [Lampetra fluviatilis]